VFPPPRSRKSRRFEKSALFRENAYNATPWSHAIVETLTGVIGGFSAMKVNGLFPGSVGCLKFGSQTRLRHTCGAKH
jgi:hypothetical protein